VRVREAVVNSLNAASLRILQGIGGPAGPAGGYRRAAAHVRRCGCNEQEAPAVGGLVLGVGEVTPAKLATAFATFANGGFRLDYYYIDRIETYGGDVVYESRPSFACGACETARAAPAQRNTQRRDGPAYTTVGSAPAGAAAEQPERSSEIVWPAVPPELVVQLAPPVPAERAVSAQNAYLVTDAMRDVIRQGSGARARALQRRDIAGKTGTTNDGRDAWFIGFTDEIAAAAWVGFDLPRSLGGSEQGGRTAIPMWIDFMREALAGVPDVEPARPPGIVEARINPKTGELASDLNCNTIVEIFEFGRLPRRESDSRYGFDGSCGRGADEQPLEPDAETPAPVSGPSRSGDIF